MRPLTAIAQPEPAMTLPEWLVRAPVSYTAQEIEAVFSRQQLRTAVHHGDAVRLLPNCYVAGQFATSFHARCHAALHWAGAGSAIGGPGALYLWGALEREPDRVHLVVDPSFKRATPDWLVTHRTRVLSAPIRIKVWDVVDPAIAIAQGYGKLRERDRSPALYSVIGSGLASTHDIRAACAELARVPRGAELMRRLDRIDSGSESFLEERAQSHIFNTREFDHLIPQFTIVARGRSYRIDLFDERARLAIELDGAGTHAELTGRQRDYRRDADLATLGIQTVRFSYHAVMNEPKHVRETVRAIIAVRTRGVEGSVVKSSHRGRRRSLGRSKASRKRPVH